MFDATQRGTDPEGGDECLADAWCVRVLQVPLRKAVSDALPSGRLCILGGTEPWLRCIHGFY